jgi:serine/threonine-protein kinase
MRLDLEEQGYKVTIKNKYDANLAPNTIIKQSPAEGSKRIIIKGQQSCDLTLTVSVGKQTIELPDMTMEDYRKIEIKLESLGLRCSIKFMEHELIPEGMVIKTEPERGTIVTKNDVITLYVSEGANIESIEMPDIVGKMLDEVDTLLSDMKLRLGDIEYKESTKPKGQILEQSVAKGEKITEGTEIHVVASKGQPEETTKTIKLKDYKNKHVEDVMNELDSLGLKYSTQAVYDDSIAEGNIVSTTPNANSEVTPDKDAKKEP